MNLLFVHQLQHLYFAIQVSQIMNGRKDVLLGFQSLTLIIDDGRLSYLADETVETLCAVSPAHTVDSQWHFQGGKPAAVGMLADVSLQQTCLERGTVGM